MYDRAELEGRDDSPTEDHVVLLRGVTWEDYERLLEIRGENAVPRLTYLEGQLEIMTPSRDHEGIKGLIGRLVETYCLENDIRFSTYGSWTLKEEKKKDGGAEPDECYIFGDEGSDRPHLAIEIVWTWGRIDKLDVYRKLGVREVWYWRKGRIQPYELRKDRYVAVDRSVALPDLDFDLLLDHLDRPTTFDSIRDYQAALRSGREHDVDGE